MPYRRPIGIFDSGLGGLSVARSIRQLLPGEDLIYVADSLHAPYGDKTPDYTLERCLSLMAFLQQQKVKAVVTACNTATLTAIQQLRNLYALPIIGVEPGIKPAASLSRSGIVGVLATRQALNSSSYQRLQRRFADRTRFEVQACDGWVEQIEKLDLDSETTQALVRRYVEPLLEKGADTLVLGCTHYAFLETLIRSVAGPAVTVVNTSNAVARQLSRRLEDRGLLRPVQCCGEEHFFSSDPKSGSRHIFSTLWGKPVAVSTLGSF